MTCPKGHLIPDNGVYCPTCFAEKHRLALQEAQFEYLRKIIAGEWNYMLRVSRAPEKHVIMFGSVKRTFCGQDLKVRPQIIHQSYSADTLAKVCAGCRAAIASVVEEILA